MSPENLDLLDLDLYVEGAPHAVWKRLRAEAPVFWQPEYPQPGSLQPERAGGPGFWSITRHADVKHISRHPELFSSAQGTNIFDHDPATLAIIQGIMINMDPPRHTEYRSLLKGGFSPRRVKRFEGFARRTAREIVDAVAPRGECDFVEEVAALLPMATICEAFGIPESDRRHCYELANRLIAADDPEVRGEESSESVLAETFAYATRLAAHKRSHPDDDLATALVRGSVDGKPMDDMVFGSYVIMMIVAGNETTRTVTSNGMLRLIEHPEQRRAVVEDPSLLPNAIEEMLRFDPAVHHFRRTAVRDTEVRGTPIRAGQKLALWYGSANRDEAVFSEPERFDVRRRNARDHLAFGVGQHFCLGANLARLQLRVIFEEVLARIPEMELAAAPRRLRSNFINGVKEMRVSFSPAPALGERAA
jgi:cytochrome P450